MGSKQHRARQLARARAERQAARQLADQRRRRRRAVVAGLVALVVLLAAVGGLLAQRWSDTTSGAAVSWPPGGPDPRAGDPRSAGSGSLLLETP
ncbi:MAG: hypothetical protein K0Q93_2027 [Nocardioidaceae bacterium]|nr:hypothetical protein [Nocardioidaceae bacterium]